jgi:hypothetical protein
MVRGGVFLRFVDTLRTKLLPMNPLRKLSLSVIEPAAGYYYWQLLECSHEQEGWKEIRRSPRGYIQWLDAFNEGFDAVLSIAKDGRFGPRKGPPADV